MKKKILSVYSTYYENIITKMAENAYKELPLKYFEIDGMEAPGVFEIPIIIAKHIKKYDAVLALGCVIKGETPHFDYISRASIDAIMKLSLENKKPIGNGIITCLNKKQAIIRSKTKGQEAAKAIVKVLHNFSVYK